jgi:hypothetical protein
MGRCYASGDVAVTWRNGGRASSSNEVRLTVVSTVLVHGSVTIKVLMAGSPCALVNDQAETAVVATAAFNRVRRVSFMGSLGNGVIAPRPQMSQASLQKKRRFSVPFQQP